MTSGGRRGQWIVVGVAAVVGIALWRWRGPVAGPGSTLDVEISLVTTDRDDLACASDRAFGRYRCELSASGEPRPAPPARADRLAPYFTTDQHLIVIAGLFEQPEIAARTAAETPLNLPRDSRPRFAARCRLTLLGRLAGFQTRWLASGTWGVQEDQAWVARPSECHILR